MFKPNPKKQVELKFVELFGRGHKLEVHGARMTPEECRRHGYRCTTRDGLFVAELFVNGDLLATAMDRDWRLSYKKLKFEVEKIFADATLSV